MPTRLAALDVRRSRLLPLLAPAVVSAGLLGCGGGGGGGGAPADPPFNSRKSSFDGSVRAIAAGIDGAVDAGFDLGTGFTGEVRAIAPATDASRDVYVGGAFTSYDSTFSPHLVRVDADGSFDAGFDVGTGFDGTVLAIAPTADGTGDVYAGGAFTSYAGAGASRIVRLDASGARDAGFALGAGFDGDVLDIAPAADGSGDVYVGGAFTAYNGLAAGRIVRLDADGTLDTGFALGAGFDGTVRALLPATDGSGAVYVGGDFTLYDGTPATRLVRLDADGAIDPGFAIGTGPDAAVLALAATADGSGDVYAGGDFTSYDGAGSNRIVRLDDDGARDATFAVGAGFDGAVETIVAAIDGSGDVYVGGDFTSYDGAGSSRMARLDADGARDAGFDVGSGFNQVVRTIRLATTGSGDVYAGGNFAIYNGTFPSGMVSLVTGRTYVGGEFTVLHGSVGSNRFTAVQPDGAVDPGPSLGTGFDAAVRAIASATDGSGDVYVGGDFSSYDGASSERIVRLDADGGRDTGFAVGSGFDGDVLAIAPAVDGSGDVYVGGEFASYGGAGSNRIARLDATGVRDAGFAVGAGFGGDVLAIAPATDGSGDVYVGGDFTTYDGAGSSFLVRLNADGTLDAGFDVGAGFNGAVVALVVATDGSGDVYAGGRFTDYDGTPASSLVRLDPDGAVDAAFDVGGGFDNDVLALATAPDGSGDVYVAGTFTSYDGTGSSAIARLDADGALDEGFDVGAGFDAGVCALAAAPDPSGEVHAGGDFTRYDGTGSNALARLAPDGALAASFGLGTGFDGLVSAIAPARDGSGDVYVGGDFTSFDGGSANRIARLDADGSRDAAFAVGAGFDGQVHAIAPALDGSGDVYVAGAFTSYDGTGAPRIARLNADGSLDLGFDVAAGFVGTVFGLAAATDGSGDVYAVGGFTTFAGVGANRIVRISPDGSRDDAFDVGSGFDVVAFAVAAAADGSGDVYVGGAFNTYRGASSSRIVRIDASGVRDAGFAVGTGLSDTANALAVARDGSGDVYAGGRFATYDGASSTRVVRIDPSGTRDAAFDVGTGLDDTVRALGVAPDATGDVYVGGDFGSYDGTPANRILRLDPSGAPVAGFASGSGFDACVLAITPAADGTDDVFVGGLFSRYDWVQVDFLAALDPDGSLD